MTRGPKPIPTIQKNPSKTSDVPLLFLCPENAFHLHFRSHELLRSPSISSSSSLQSQRHFSKRNPNSRFKPKRSTKCEPLSVSAPSSGVEATTYTRLPSKQDFSAPSSESSNEIKLFGSDIAQFDCNDLSGTETDSGGDGGRGGNVYVEVDAAMNSLLPFRNGVHFRAGKGGHGQGRMQKGGQWRGCGCESDAGDGYQGGWEGGGIVGTVVSGTASIAASWWERWPRQCLF
ncbi:hypothetical protein SLEP1_g184 [Rubroshorea leprosula]|uniref:Obg domain-containing protein n=1 Tax=Rubroshorea leprosula TaxID=152421 RepID=A0AAV5HGP1_9ROSI|nr:hypothetical protein SLEP1_g184 [Rubroshorea leprosula]